MDTSERVEPPDAGLINGIRKNAGLTVACGVILVVAGTLALLSPFVAGVSITILVGVMLAVSGIGQSFLAFKTGALGRGLMVFVVGILMAIAGIYMMSQPVAGLATLTIILMAYLLATGALEIVVAFQIKPSVGWGLQLFNGIVTLLLGILLWRQFPLSGVWAFGILFGIKMIFSGWAFVIIGRSVKRIAAHTETA